MPPPFIRLVLLLVCQPLIAAETRHAGVCGRGEEARAQTPCFPNEYFKVGEPWCAWVDQNNLGIGLHMPRTSQITCYRVRNGNQGDCSHLAPIQTFALKPGLAFEYEVVLAIGSLGELQSLFGRLK